MLTKSLKAKVLIASLTTAAMLATGVAPANATDADGEVREQLLKAVQEDTVADTATFKVHHGVDADGEQFDYVVTESSNSKDAARRKVNRASKLANAKNTAAAQRGWYDAAGVLHVQDTVDFSPTRVVTPGPGGFPPLAASPGAVGEAGYSPLVQLPNGIVINAPHVRNATGDHDKLTAPVSGGYATFKETEGSYNGHDVYYVSFDSSAPDVAALEGVTFAPNLNAAPGLGDGGGSSARSGIAPFANGQTGVDNPNRQGLNSALLGEGDPLNVVQSRPGQGKYSPLWDVHLSVWSDEAVASGANVRQVDFDDVKGLGAYGTLTGPGGSPWGAVGAIVNCPIISIVD